MDKKGLKFWEFALLAVFVFTFILLMMWAAHLILPSIAHADQLDYSSISTNWSGNMEQLLGNGITDIPSLYWYYKCDGDEYHCAYGSAVLYIMACDNADSLDSPLGNSCTNQTFLAITTRQALSALGYIYNTNLQLLHYDFALTGLNADKYLRFYIYNDSPHSKYAGTTSGTQSAGFSISSVWQTNGLKSIYWSFTLPPPTISISFPTGTISAPPTSTSLLWTNPNATSTMNFTYSVWYGSSLLYSKFDYITDYSATSGTKTFELNYPFYNLMTYTEVATLNQSAPTSTSVSTTTTFYIQPPYYGGQSTTTATTTAIGGYAGTACNDPNVNFFVGFFCSIFIPQQATFSQWSNLQLALVNKPPLGYLTAISGVMSATSTATTSLDAITLPSGASSPFTIFRTSLLWLLWAIYGVYLFNRFRHLQI